MQVSVENKGTLERLMSVTVPGDQVSGRVESKLKELGGQVRLKGFRPGKVPFSVLRQRYGTQVRQEVLSEVLQESYREALESESLRPASEAKIDIKSGELAGDLEFEVQLEVYPELGEIDISDIELEALQAEVGEPDVDDMIKTLQLQRREWDDVKRKSKKSDLVVIEFSASFKGGVYPESGTERVGSILGTKALSASFEKVMTGVKNEEEHSAEVKFPKDFRIEQLAGKTAKVEFSVVRVAAEKLPEVDADFISSFGVADGDMDQFRRDVKENLERELRNALRTRGRAQVMDALVGKYADFELPAGMIRAEREQLKATLEQQKTPVTDSTDEEISKEAARRVRSGLVMVEIGRQQSIEIDMGRLRDRISDEASTYENPAQIVEMYYQNEQLLNSVRQAVLEDQVVDWVLENAKVIEKESSFKELLRS